MRPLQKRLATFISCLVSHSYSNSVMRVSVGLCMWSFSWASKPADIRMKSGANSTRRGMTYSETSFRHFELVAVPGNMGKFEMPPG